MLVVVHLVVRGELANESTYYAAMVLSAIATGAAWRVYRRTPRSPWNWIVAGVACSAIGDLCYLALSQRGNGDVGASIADLAWIAAYTMFGIAMLALLRRDERRFAPDIDVLLDVATVVAIAVPLLWELSPNDLWADGSVAVWDRATWLIYPVLDAVLIALAIRLLATRVARTPAVALLLFGIGAWLSADVGAIFTRDGVGIWLDVGWMVGAGLIAASAIRGLGDVARDQRIGRSQRGADSDAPIGPPPTTPWRLAFSVLAMLVPTSLVLVSDRAGSEMNPAVFLVSTLALGALLFARTVLLLREMHAAEQQLRSSGAYYQALAANSSDAVIVCDRDGSVLNDSSNLGHLVGSGLDSAVGWSLLDLIWLAEPERARQVFEASVATPGAMFELEVRLVDATRSERWLAARVVNLLHDPSVGGVVINLHDITARKHAEDSLEHQAFHDDLTGLANRALFQDRVVHAMEMSVPTGVAPAVLYLDLDGFKRVNDTLGHDVGDRLLRQVASRLGLVVRDSDTVSRLGGDEFAILVEQGAASVAAVATAERILDALRVPVQLGTQSITVSASIGIAVGDVGGDVTTLLRDADTAMYQAKANGRGRIELYRSEMRELAMERLRIETELPIALELGQFRLVYQPVVELASGRVNGFEALLRWDHPEHGPIPPDRFIPICEENGMIHPLGDWVLRTACATAARWQESGHCVTIAVNISGRQLSSESLVDLVREVLDRSGLRPGSLVLEVTETSLVDDAEAAAARLKELRQLGVQLAIDDFGTGYSSLAYLQLFPVDILKIDGSFVQCIDDPESVPAIIPGLLGLGRTLGLQVIAEGIEHEVQRTWLQAEGCVYGQGYLFSTPLSADEAVSVLHNGLVTTPA